MENIFSERLRSLRKKSHLTQEELASEINVGKGVIGDLERGQRNPSKRVAGKLAVLFDTDIEFWLDVDAELKKFEKEKQFNFLNDSLLSLKKSGKLITTKDLRKKKNLDIILELIAYELDLDDPEENK